MIIPSKSLCNTCVVLVSYRGATDTAFCLESLQKSVIPVSVVVVDTTPRDAELKLMLAGYPNVNLISATMNLGFGRGSNLGIRYALKHTESRYIFLLNNDASVLPESIGILECAMQEYPEIEVVTPRIAFQEEPNRLWYGGGDIDWRRASAFTPGFYGDVNAPMALKERNVTFASGCALLVRRSAMSKMGGFDPRYFMYEEDVEWCLRAQVKKVRIRYIPSSLIFHRAQGGSREDENYGGDFWAVRNPKLSFYAFHVVRNRMLNIYKYAQGRNVPIVLVFFPLFLLRRALPFLIGGRMDAVISMLKGIVDSWQNRRPLAVDELVG